MGRDRSFEVLARARAPELLEHLLGSALREVRAPQGVPPTGVDQSLELEGRRFLIEYKAGRLLGPRLLDAWERVRRHSSGTDVPLLFVPSLTGPALALCREHGINWLDASGNASVHAPGLHLVVSGRTNQLPRRGRPASVFERRSSRLARTLLLELGRDWSVRESATASGLDEGHVSRIVKRLTGDGLVVREGRRFHVASPEALLDAWRDGSDFTKHRALHGHVAARSGEELLRALSERLDEVGIAHAATGLGAAWLYDHFAMFRLATVYLRTWPTDAQLERLHYRDAPAGPNVWLVLPTDDGVFDGQRVVEGVPCVHPAQVYVDLKAHPERAKEAAEHLKSQTLLVHDENGGP